MHYLSTVYHNICSSQNICLSKLSHLDTEVTLNQIQLETRKFSILKFYVVLTRSLVSLVSGDQPPRPRSSKSGTVYFVLDEVSTVHTTRLRTLIYIRELKIRRRADVRRVAKPRENWDEPRPRTALYSVKIT